MATIKEETNTRYIQRMGQLLAEAEQRAVEARVERDFYVQELTVARTEIQSLQERLAEAEQDPEESDGL